MLDSDNMPLVNPEVLFESEQYTKDGVLACPDFWKNTMSKPDIYKVGGWWDAWPDFWQKHHEQARHHKVAAGNEAAARHAPAAMSTLQLVCSHSEVDRAWLAACATPLQLLKVPVPWEADSSYREAESGQVLFDRVKHADVLEWLW